MRALPSGLQALLDSGASTLCWCWRVTRTDGVVFGFTDHDRDLTFDGTTFEAASGFTGTELHESIGLSVDQMQVESALTSTRITEDDIHAGRYDDAAVDLIRVNWASVADRFVVKTGTIGEVRRGRQSFTAEMRGIAHALGQEQGRTYQAGCDVDLGATKCGIDLTLAIYKGAGTVATFVTAKAFTATGLDAFAADWFARGKLTWTAGANSGLAADVKLHGNAAGVVTIEVWQNPAKAVAVADTFDITAGCDKSWDTCRNKFANGDNFRGFPHMPGNSYLTKLGRRGR